MKSNKRENNYKKIIKYKNLQSRAVANDYLSNISLNGNNDFDTKTNYYEKVISNDFGCFLTFNQINTKSDQQTDYFNYYKQKQIKENPNSNRLTEFLQNEFDQVDLKRSRTYIDNIIANKKTRFKKKPGMSFISNNSKNSCGEISNTNVPSIKIVLSNTFNNANELAIGVENSENNPLRGAIVNTESMSDVEFDYLNSQAKKINKNLSSVVSDASHLCTSNGTISSTSSNSIQMNEAKNKLAQSLNSALYNQNNKSKKVLSEATKTDNSKLLPINANQAVIAAQPKTANQLPHKLERTISESSNDSNYYFINSTNTSNRNLGAYSSISSTNKALMHYKPSLFNSLKRLTNEKLLLTSNNSPIGVFSRLPFKLNGLK